MTNRVDAIEVSMLIDDLNDTSHGVRLSRKAAKALRVLLAERDRLLEAPCPVCARRKAAAREVVRIKAICDTCGYQSIDYIGAGSMCLMDGCYGGMYPPKQEKSDD